MSVAAFLQRLADKTNVIGSTAAAAGLYHHHGQALRIIIPRRYRIHDLAGHDHRRIACIVIDIALSHINDVVVLILHQRQTITAGFKCRLGQFEMMRGHFRTQDRISRVVHLFRIFHSRIFHRSHFFLRTAVSGTDRCCQGTHTDTCRTQVADLIDLQ